MDELDGLYESIDRVFPHCKVDGNGGAKFAGFFTKSFILPPFLWQSALLGPGDKSITQRPKRRHATHAESEAQSMPERMPQYMPLLPKSKSILLIGDSHVEYGIDFGPDGWFNTIQGNLGLQSVINRGASGYNSRAIITQVLPVIQEEFRRNVLNLVELSLRVLWVGSFDSYVQGTIKDSIKVPIDEFKQNIMQLIEVSQY